MLPAVVGVVRGAFAVVCTVIGPYRHWGVAPGVCLVFCRLGVVAVQRYGVNVSCAAAQWRMLAAICLALTLRVDDVAKAWHCS